MGVGETGVSPWRRGRSFYHVEKRYQRKPAGRAYTRQSIIQLCSIPDCESYYNVLSAILGLKLDLPPLHVTLYTKGRPRQLTARGIGISSEAAFRALNPTEIPL